MSGSILENIMGLIGPQLVGSLASRLGEPEGAVKKGLEGGSAAILGSLAARAGDSGFLGRIFGMISNAPQDLGSTALASLTGGGKPPDLTGLAGDFVSQIFGPRQSAVVSAIAGAAGLKAGSATGILGMAAPLVMGLLGQRVREGGLNQASLGRLLSAEGPALQRFLPAGLGSLLGGDSNLSSPAPLPRAAASGFGKPWLWPVLGLLLLAALAWMYWGRGAEVAEKTAVAPVTTAVSSPLGEFFKRQLPNGIEINIPRLGVENKLIDFIEDSTRPVDKTTWFDFDRLVFDVGKSTLTPGSQEQLNSVAGIMKAYPKVKLKIGGYTDNTGDPAANLKLSNERANAAMAALVQAGVDPLRLSAEGYGQEFPIADNATEDGRAKNRRTSMRVAEK